MAGSRRAASHSNQQRDWQIEKLTNSDRARHMLETSLYADCEFLVGGNDDVKELIKAHKIFLAMGSPVFEAMFFGGMAQATSAGTNTQEQPIAVPDLRPSAFRDLLEYIYTERLDLKSFDQAYCLCYAANKYLVPNLVDKCSQFMWKDLGPENVCRALEFANLYEHVNLKFQCMEMIRALTKQAFSSSEFEEIEEATLLILVKENDLDIKEVELFEAVKRWATRQCTQHDIEPTGPNMRQALNKIISHIRFLAMTHEEFASSPAVSGVLTQDEGFAILMNLSSRDKWPMPENFSVEREQRIPQFDHQGLAAGGNSGRQTPALSVRSLDGVGPSHSHGLSASPISGGPVGSFSSLSASPSGAPISGPPGQRIYCYRRVEGETLVHNTGILDCAVTLTVDRNVCIHGIVMASQTCSRQDESASEAMASGYTELLYCHLLDRDGTRLTYSHFSGRSPRRSTIDVFFNRPVYVQRNRDYRICIVLNRCGYYPLGTASTWVISQGVHFRFGGASTDAFPGSLGEGIRDGFIRGIIFSF